jgi:NitT/TauT family transport system substrate-binding protein
MKKQIQTALAGLAILALAGCASGGDAGANGGSDKLTMLFPVGSIIQYHPWYIAEEKGWFKEEGVNVALEIGDGSSGILQQVISGNADAALPSPGAVLTAVNSGHDLRMIYQYQYGNIFSLGVPASSDIKEPSQLAGTTIGVSEMSGGEVPLVRAVLRDAGVGIDSGGNSAHLLEVGAGGALAIQSLQKGDVQSYSSNLFDLATMESQGIPMRNILPENIRSFPANGVVVTADALKNNKDSLAAMQRAVAKATKWAEENPEEAKAIAAKIAPEEFEDQKVADAAWTVAVELRTPSHPETLMGTPLRSGWDLFYEFLQQGDEMEGAVADNLNLDKLLDLSLLESINSFSAPSAAAKETK